MLFKIYSDRWRNRALGIRCNGLSASLDSLAESKRTDQLRVLFLSFMKAIVIPNSRIIRNVLLEK
jgi:hypothetical protein